MNIFVAGGSGAIGRVLVPLLVADGHQVVVLTRAAERARLLERVGAVAVIGDVYDQASLIRSIAAAEPSSSCIN